MDELAGLLQVIAARARLPLEGALTLPPAAYRSDGLAVLERERIFAGAWLCAGHVAEIPKSGDYLTYEINDQPVMVIRQADGSVRALSNVCLHRMMKLVDGRGTCPRRIVCPYHGWTYQTDGKLMGAPHMQRSEGFDARSLALPVIRSAVWEGWIYVTLDANAPDLAAELAPLLPVVAPYRMADYVSFVTQDHVWQTNWKLLTENFMEGYHLPVAHRETVGAWMPVDETEFPAEVHPAVTWQTFTKRADAKYGVAHPGNTVLQGRWRNTSVMPTIFPCHMYVLAPDHWWYLSLRPRGVGEVHVRFGAAVAPERLAALEDRDSFVAETVAFFDKVNAEDRFVTEGIYQGAQAPLAASGRLSWLEREIHDFIGYLDRRLNPSR